MFKYKQAPIPFVLQTKLYRAPNSTLRLETHDSVGSRFPCSPHSAALFAVRIASPQSNRAMRHLRPVFVLVFPCWKGITGYSQGTLGSLTCLFPA